MIHLGEPFSVTSVQSVALLPIACRPHFVPINGSRCHNATAGLLSTVSRMET